MRVSINKSLYLENYRLTYLAQTRKHPYILSELLQMNMTAL